MLKRILGKKVIYPAKYYTIWQTDELIDGKVQSKKERILIQNSRIQRLGGLIERTPQYDFIPFSVFRPESTIICRNTGKSTFSEQTTEIIYRPKITGYIIEFKPSNLLKPMPLAINEQASTRQKYNLKTLCVTALSFFLPKEIRQEVIGDILEDFKEQENTLGKLVHLWLVKEVTFTLINIFLNWLGRVMRIVD